LGKQPGAQHVGEQMVVTPSAAFGVPRQQEQIRSLNRLQKPLTPAAAEYRIAQRPGQPFQHRCLQQERAQLLGLAVEHLLGQVVKDVAVTAGELGDEPAESVRPRSASAANCSPATQPSVRSPSATAAVSGSVSPAAAQQLGGLVDGEAQRGRGDLGQLPAHPHPGQRQRRVGSAGHHQPQRRRQVLEQEFQ
jgi:hypothetical protein